MSAAGGEPLDTFHPAVRQWFREAFPAPTRPQALAWPVIRRGDSTLLLAPTGSGKTLAAFLSCLDRLMFSPEPDKERRCRVLYVSPLKALAVDVERNLRSPLAGIANLAERSGERYRVPTVAVRSGDTPQSERARFARAPADILITTPESLYLLLTSNAREALRSVDTVILDEIHALVPTKRGAHLALSLERLERLVDGRLQRIGLSATQRPLEEIARFLGGADWKAAAQPQGRPALETIDAISPGPAGDEAEVPTRRRTRRGPRTAPPATSSERPERGALRRKAASAREVRAEAPEVEAIATGAPGQELHSEFRDAQPRVPYRPVTIVDAGSQRRMNLRIEVPVEDMAKLGQPIELPSGPASQGPVRASIWTAIHPRLLELVRSHRSTLLFVNSRRIAERLSAALNELAGEVLVQSHHGSIARAQRIEIEDNLKAGKIRGLVATSSLELGIDMGAVDLVIQIEAPPSVASGMQRIGRAGHQVEATSAGILFPKYRADLLACAAITRAMRDGRVESTRYPRNPLDVLAQQIVAMVSMEEWRVDALYAALRGAAPYAELSPSIFEGVLDMIAGRYVSDEFADLRPRITWDRVTGRLTAREGARRVAVINGGTIPDRGLYGVYLVGSERASARVGELDEEMVFECRVGETFLLGASTWRIEQITHDRVLVSPAPGQPGKMPFWHGDAQGRPLELGLTIGRLVRSLRQLPRQTAVDTLVREHDLDARAAENLLQYLDDQASAAGVVPDDQTLVIERVRDELGDWRLCVLSPIGGQVLAPWSMAVVAKAREELGLEVETLWTNDGFVVRFPESDAPPDISVLLPRADEVEALVLRQLGSSALFAAKFREAAARALLLPKRNPRGRAPLWQQRKRAADLLSVASRYGSFPILLESYRECLRDVFDLPALANVLRQVEGRQMRVQTVDSTTPSPFAGSLLFGFVANFIYDGDAPLAERRAQALSIDQAQLRELLGEAELRELLDPDALAEVERGLQHLEPRLRARSIDGVHDLLLRLGDLSAAELSARSVSEAVAEGVEALVQARRAVVVTVRGERRFIAVEDVARYRDGLGVQLPPGLPDVLLRPLPNPRVDLLSRYARTHGPFTTGEVADRLGLSRAQVETALTQLHQAGRLLEGAFRPGGTQREWCAPEVLDTVRRRSLAKLRKEVEPVEPRVLGRFCLSWQGLTRKARGLDALLDVIERLQGCALPASILESELLSARIEAYSPTDLDALLAAGEVVWVGVEPLGERDGRVALYLTDHLGKLLRREPVDPAALSERERRLLEALERSGASFFADLHRAVGDGFQRETVDALWRLVWKGLVTNDTLHPLRAYARPPAQRERRIARDGRVYRSRRAAPAAAEGRWSLVSQRERTPATPTEWSAAIGQQLLVRYGLVTRETAAAESLPGGFSAVYDVYKAFEESGRIRRGYFVSGVGALQFALPPVLDLLRSLRDDPDTPEVISLAATDPANPYGAILKWPELPELAGTNKGPTRSVGASVILVNGALAAVLGRGARALFAYLPENEPDRGQVMRAIAGRLVELARGRAMRGDGLLLEEINGGAAREHPLASALQEAGFTVSVQGLHLARLRGERLGQGRR